MTEEPQMFAVPVTPEMQERLNQLQKDLLEVLENRTESPFEALIVLDAVKKTLEARHEMFLMFPIDETNSAQS